MSTVNMYDILAMYIEEIDYFNLSSNVKTIVHGDRIKITNLNNIFLDELIKYCIKYDYIHIKINKTCEDFQYEITIDGGRIKDAINVMCYKLT